MLPPPILVFLMTKWACNQIAIGSPKSKGWMVGPHACKRCVQNTLHGLGICACNGKFVENLFVKKHGCKGICGKEKVWLQSKLNS
jgi:hypothetical protein